MESDRHAAPAYRGKRASVRWFGECVPRARRTGPRTESCGELFICKVMLEKEMEEEVLRRFRGNS